MSSAFDSDGDGIDGVSTGRFDVAVTCCVDSCPTSSRTTPFDFIRRRGRTREDELESSSGAVNLIFRPAKLCPFVVPWVVDIVASVDVDCCPPPDSSASRSKVVG